MEIPNVWGRCFSMTVGWVALSVLRNIVSMCLCKIIFEITTPVKIDRGTVLNVPPRLIEWSQTRQCYVYLCNTQLRTRALLYVHV